ncbi:hypothetical protein ACFV7R_21390 [Streptomyces sp. NPDC059866]
MNSRLTWSLAGGLVLIALLVVFSIYGTHAGTILGRLGLSIF